MIFWALALGVSFVSIYDRKGLILRNESVLRKSLETKTIEYVGVAKKACCQIDLHSMAEADRPGVGLKNGHYFYRLNVCGRIAISKLIPNNGVTDSYSCLSATHSAL